MRECALKVDSRKKKLGALGNRTCVGDVPVRCSNQLSYIPSRWWKDGKRAERRGERERERERERFVAIAELLMRTMSWYFGGTYISVHRVIKC